MEKFSSHYPDFDVMKEREHWDPHTREIVESRLVRKPYKTLSDMEATTLTHLTMTLLADDRADIISYVVSHFDSLLSSNIGEAQRKKGVPKRSVLIRGGIRALDQHCTEKYGMLFSALEKETQHQILDEMMRGQLTLQADGVTIPAKDLFTTLLVESTSAYYSHPSVWSDIGYAGPAYPRGYVRSEWGLTDPWEAKRKDAK